MIFHNSEFDFRRQECTKIRSKIASKIACLKFAAKTPQDASKTLTRRPKKLSDLPQDAPQTPQDASKTPPRRPKRPPRGRQDGPRWPQYAPKTPQDSPKTPPRRPKRAQDCPETAPRGPQDGPRSSKTLIFVRFSNVFC